MPHPDLSTQKKTIKHSITAFLSNRNSSSDWLLGGFLFGTEIWGGQFWYFRNKDTQLLLLLLNCDFSPAHYHHPAWGQQQQADCQGARWEFFCKLNKYYSPKDFMKLTITFNKILSYGLHLCLSRRDVTLKSNFWGSQKDGWFLKAAWVCPWIPSTYKYHVYSRRSTLHAIILANCWQVGNQLL